MTNRPIRQAVVAPSMMYLLYPLDAGSSRTTSWMNARRTFGLASPPARREVIEVHRRGALRPATIRQSLDDCQPDSALLEQTIGRRSLRPRSEGLGVQSAGGEVDSVCSADVPDEELLNHLFKLNAGYFQLQLASERDRDFAYKLVAENLREDAKGIPQMAYIGCIVTQSPRPEVSPGGV